MPAFRTAAGAVHLWNEVPDSLPLRLPCGGCLGCRTAQAKAWTLRCQLELSSHDRAAFATLTYDEEHCPPTLRRRDLQLFIKRTRKALGNKRALRFFSCGEYGERTLRPHYHAILYNLDDRDGDLIHDAWGQGHTKTANVTRASIAYTAGYTAKKIGWRETAAEERIDYSTGEIYKWQPPFLQMSRRPGIGGEARKYKNSWRLFAIHDGTRMPVPRFLHEAWKQQATPLQLEDLLYEKSQLAAKKTINDDSLKAAEQIAIAKQYLQSQRRNL